MEGVDPYMLINIDRGSVFFRPPGMLLCFKKPLITHQYKLRLSNFDTN